MSYETDVTPETIKSAGFDFEQLDSFVYLIKNFITEEECVELMDIAKNATPEEWLENYLNGIKDRVEARHGTRDLEQTKTEITYDWQDKVIRLGENQTGKSLMTRLAPVFSENSGLYVRSFGIIQRQYEGAELKGHYDQYVDKRMIWAAVLYINEDYADGEFYFRDKGIEIRPPRKSLLLFPATEEYWHGVKKVGKGPVRYAVPTFIWNDPKAF
jgi:hypothetical protein